MVAKKKIAKKKFPDKFIRNGIVRRKGKMYVWYANPRTGEEKFVKAESKVLTVDGKPTRVYE
jgi:ribosomal protein L36